MLAEDLASARTYEEPRARITRALRRITADLRGSEEEGWGKRDLHHDDYRLSSRAKCLRAAAKGREVERKGERKSEGGREGGWEGALLHTPAGDRRFCSRVDGEGGRARGMKVGMFVVRVIWPIKPRGGARRAPASRRSRIDDRRGERAGREAATAEGAKGARGPKEMGSGARRA